MLRTQYRKLGYSMLGSRVHWALECTVVSRLDRVGDDGPFSTARRDHFKACQTIHRERLDQPPTLPKILVLS